MTARARPVKPRRYSAGIMLYRRSGSPGPQVLLGHMGGPLWTRRDVGAWSIPKGGYERDEDPFTAARREYVEEIGVPLPDVPDDAFIPLGDVVQANNKLVTAWAVEGDLDPAQAVSNTFELEWPPRSGRRQSFPEFDRVAWFELDDAAARIVEAQARFVQRLRDHLVGPPAG